MGAMTGADVPERIAARAPVQGVANDLDGNLRQAQLLRLAGKHDEAIQILSQLTLVAADNPRVVSEYGKALVQKGRARDATQFLRRAVELAPDDGSVYSALGVAYDQTGDHVSARAAYERALLLRPGDAAVLNNYALSRMMAKDPDGARRLIAMAEGSATGPADERIARNAAMIQRMAPGAPAVAVAAAPAPVAPAPQPPVAFAEAPPPADTDAALAVALQGAQADAAPRALQPQSAPAAAQPARRVVMQAVPFDPLAGPVKPRARATAAAKKPVQQAQVPALRVAAEAY